MAKYRSWVATHNGAPALFVNGEPRFLNAPYFAKAPYETFAAAETGIYLVHDGAFGVAEDGTPDISSVRTKAEEVFAKEPDALIIVRTFPPAPRWWLDRHPDEELRFDCDTSEYPGYAGYRDVSWASDVWLDAVCGWYEEWCRQLHERFDGQVIGQQFGMGSNGENNPIGAPTNDGRWFCGDFSAPMLNYFRSWLRNRHETDEALKAAWEDDAVTLDTASVPDRVERLRTDWFTFRSPRRAHAADYYQAFAERIEVCVIAICEAIKRGANGECIAGSHLGGLLDNGFHGYIYHQACIDMVRRALEHPAVDTFTSPASYENRDPGGDASSMMPTGSMALHGKLIFQDQDTRTCVLPEGYRENFILGDIAADIPETLGVLKRDFAHMLIRGYGLWWHAMVKGMYDHPEISAGIAKLSQIGKESLNHPRGTAEGAAIIVDEESVFHQACTNRLFYSMLYYQRQYYWGRSGVAWDVFLHNDLGHPEMPEHKLYYFLNTFYLTDEEIAVIERKVKKDNAIVVWTYAPGIQSPDGLSLERVERLTGFRLKALDVQALPRIIFTDLEHPFIRYEPPSQGDRYMHGSRQPMFIGVGPMGNDERERGIGPVIYVDDPEATVLGELDCLLEPGFCVKEMDGWTSVFCAAPMLNQYVLRNIARAAGLHVYSEGDDVVLPGRTYLMVHAKTAGEKVVCLPQPTDVYECYDDRLIGRGITEIRDTLPKHGTAIYFLGTP